MLSFAERGRCRTSRGQSLVERGYLTVSPVLDLNLGLRLASEDAPGSASFQEVSRQPMCRSGNSSQRSNGIGCGAPIVSSRRAMPFDIWSDLALTALCGTALVTWIGRDLAARARQRLAHP